MNDYSFGRVQTSKTSIEFSQRFLTQQTPNHQGKTIKWYTPPFHTVRTSSISTVFNIFDCTILIRFSQRSILSITFFGCKKTNGFETNSVNLNFIEYHLCCSSSILFDTEVPSTDTTVRTGL
ncbi:unnamed protein product [Adineta ricciae]|uniref:Uncharacterized protein n=1 Tax=Adineta ricciae TaxID=249248 RepID=A0A813QLS0_ADIRI|nr:unnamed protein product [Adineta ricciae]